MYEQFTVSITWCSGGLGFTRLVDWSLVSSRLRHPSIRHISELAESALRLPGGLRFSLCSDSLVGVRGD